MSKKTTLQTVEMLQDSTLNTNLQKRYGTSVNEYMSREHTKEVLQKINILRGLFENFGKTKTSSLSAFEVQDFLSKINVKKYFLLIFIYRKLRNKLLKKTYLKFFNYLIKIQTKKPQYPSLLMIIFF